MHIDISYLVTTTRYAAIHGRAPSSVRALVTRRSLKTAVKIGNAWMIDRREPYPDRRIRTGKYKNWRRRVGRK